MSKSPSSRSSLQVFALLFLLLGGGFGALTGFRLKAISDGQAMNVTILTTDASIPSEFNWLLFSIGFSAGLVACAVLLAASFLVPTTDIGTASPTMASADV